MGKFIFVVVAAIACFIAVESLSCNKCTFGLVGVCLNKGTETCATNVTTCFTGKATFSSLSSFVGFNTQGCNTNSTGCNATTTGTLLGVTYSSVITCCSSDNCNPITISGAPSTKMTFTAAAGAAILASVLGSVL